MNFLGTLQNGIKAIFFIALMTLSGLTSAQWGPGGVGNTNGTLVNANRVQPAMRGWYRADNGPGVVNGKVQNWQDRSGRNIHLTQADAALQPTFVSNVVNSRPVVRFSGVPNCLLAANVVPSGTVPSSAMTLFAVAKNSATASSVAGLISYDGYQGLICSYTTNVGTQYILDGNGANAGNAANTGNITSSAFRLLSGVYGTSTNTNQSSMYMDGRLEEYFTGGGSPGLTAYSKLQLGGRTWGNFPARVFNGDIAEIISYDTRLDSAQRIIVETYLAAKYGITLANNRFPFASSNRHEVAGIGQAVNGSRHDSASSNFITVAAPQSLANNRYMFFGHNSAAFTLGTNETPGNDVNFVRRMDREWRFSKSGGDLGTTRLYVDFSLLDASVPAGFTRGIFIDADGDFRTGATFVDLLPNAANVYVTPRINIPHGSYVTIGAIKRVVAFSTANSQGFEDQTEYPVIRASLNFVYDPASSVDVVADYTVSNFGTHLPMGPCFDVNACDYDNGRSQVVIPAGQLFMDINQDAFDVDAGLRINNDTTSEPNAELVRLTITNVANAGMGSRLTHDYSIIDDDFFRKISFISGQNNITWPELDAGAFKDTTLIVTLPIDQTGGPSFVTVAVTGPTKAGKDYILLDALSFSDSLVRLQISENDFQVPLRIRLLGDDSFENNEVMTLLLTRPSSATLSGVNPITASITIQDNDPMPIVNFTPVSGSGQEGISSIQIKVKLGVESGKLVTVPFNFSGTAIGNGDDFNIISPSPLYFQPGDTVAFIQAEIIQENLEEDEETIVLNLLSPINATVGASPTFTYTIIDEDVYGATGPGGVDQNNGGGSLELWFSADENVTVTTGTVSRWSNLSGAAGRDALPVSGHTNPTLVTNQLNGRPIIRFNGNQLSGSFISSSPSSPVTILTVARQSTAPPTVGGQTLGTIFGTDRWAGISSYGSNYLAEGFTTSPSFIYPSVSNTSNTNMGSGAINSFQLLTVQYTQNNTQNSSFYRNSVLEETHTGSGVNLDFHSNFRLGVRHPASSGYFFRGDVAEVIFFSSELNAARRIIVENYLASKYNLTVANNYFSAAPTGFRNSVGGIGTSDGSSNNKHRVATSAGLTVRQLNNSLNTANEYVFFGRNSGAAATYVDIVQTQQLELWTRQWFIQKTGNVDISLTFDYDAVGITHVPLAVTEYQLLFKPTALDDWTFVPFTARTLENNQVHFELANGDVAQGFYTLGRTDPITLPVVFGSFEAYKKGSSNQLRWTTLSEENSDRFEIERSTDGKKFQKLATVQAAGFSSSKLSYGYTDVSPSTGRVYYRLRQVDRNEAALYSPVRQIQQQTTGAGFTKVTVYPNPTTGTVHIELPESVEISKVTILDGRGVILAQPSVYLEGNTSTTDISTLKAGLYLLKLQLSNGETLVRSLVKQ